MLRYVFNSHTDRQTDEGNYYSTIYGSMSDEAPIMSNRPLPAMPERRGNSRQDDRDRAEEVNPESVPYFL